MTALFAVSLTSMMINIIPKLYALGTVFLLILPYVFKEEDKRRKYAFRAITINEYRV
jgi:hypothetical protein